jgi:hypothetical protein
MIEALIILYCTLSLISFGLQGIVLSQVRFFYPALILSLLYYVAAFVLYKSGMSHAPLAFFLTWWTYFLLVQKTARWQFIKENDYEPILTKGSSYDSKTGRKAHLADYIFTLIIVVVPIALCFVTELLANAIIARE